MKKINSYPEAFKKSITQLKYFFLTVFLSTGLFVSAQQENDLPQEIESAFNMKYPKWSIDTWSYDDGTYYIEFYRKGGIFTSAFDENGTWIETTEVIPDEKIPAAVTEYIKKNYPTGELLYAENVENSNSTFSIRVYLSIEEELLVITSDNLGNNIDVTITDD